VSTTTSKGTPTSPSPSNRQPAEPGATDETDAELEIAFPVETDIVIHANGDVTIADLPQELQHLLALLNGGHP
jgi:hypothetical protein